MTIDQLKYFIVAAELLNFTEAANRLYVSQPTLSYGINRLEDILQLKLFHRGKRTVTLTASGQAFYESIKDIVFRIESAVDYARSLEQSVIQGLNLGFLGSLSRRFFPTLIPNIFGLHPNIRLNLIQMEMDQLCTALENGEVDIALTRSVCLQNKNWVMSQKICDDPLFLVVRNDHPLADRELVELHELANESFILEDENYSSYWNKYIKLVCKQNGLNVQIEYTTANSATIDTMIVSGLGVSLRPESCKFNNFSERLSYIPILGEGLVSDAIVAWRVSNQNQSIPILLKSIKTYCDEIKLKSQEATL